MADSTLQTAVSTASATRICRIHVEKRSGYEAETDSLLHILRSQLKITGLERLRLLKRYDFPFPGEGLADRIRDQVLSDPAADTVCEETLPGGRYIPLAIEYLPGQFDARAEAASQAVSIILDRPAEPVRCARIYLFYGDLSGEEMEKIRRYLINPVDSREASLEPPDSLVTKPDRPSKVAVLRGFSAMNAEQLSSLRQRLGLAMFQADIELCRDYFAGCERRDPTMAELKVLDTYWSDHCRHTTFTTGLKRIEVQPGRFTQPVSDSLHRLREIEGEGELSLMDIALAGMRFLRRTGRLKRLEKSVEVNAASVLIDVSTPSGTVPWLLMFKNETHNHPTEIEPFGGAATCLGGAIRDPLSGRAYVYQALRLTGSADPRQPFDAVRPGKLPQRVITTEAARGYSSYGNQIGIPTGYVQELYHPGYEAKRMEVGAVVGAAPKSQVKREKPFPGDVVLLVGGATGRDGIGGATGSSKRHDSSSLVNAAAEVQKGNPPEERALQRFFRDPEVALRIKRSNDFGAGGVSVAVGELAAGLEIDLDALPRKYEGLDGLELALSESQERMAIVVAPNDAEFCMHAALRQNLKATQIAQVTDEGRLVMRWRGEVIVDLSREFLDSSGAPRTGEACIAAPDEGGPFEPVSGTGPKPGRGDYDTLTAGWLQTIGSLAGCSRRGLTERFDSTIGARSVLVPFGGEFQLTPAEATAAKIPVSDGETESVSIMAAGCDPVMASWSPYHGGLYAVVEAVSRAVAAGAGPDEMYLSLQEYFERLETDPFKWGKPVAALLGALQAQLDLEIAAIGGKDSMSGSFEELHVPPTLAAFAVAPARLDDVISPEFKAPDHTVVLVRTPIDRHGTPDLPAFRRLLEYVHDLISGGIAVSCRSLRTGGIISAVTEMTFGNMIGFAFCGSGRGKIDRPPAGTDGVVDTVSATGPEFVPDLGELSRPGYGGFLLELSEGTGTEDLPRHPEGCELKRIGITTREKSVLIGPRQISLHSLLAAWEAPLEEVFPVRPREEKASACSCQDLFQGGAAAFSRQDITAHPDPISRPAGKSTPARVARPAPGSRSARVARRNNSGRPKVCIPVFPGTNCEDETALQFRKAGAEVEMQIFRTGNISQIEESIDTLSRAVKKSQILMMPGGFSAGDEPDGSGKYIAAVLRSPRMMAAVLDLLGERDGLILGICNGFQALLRTGLLPFGEYRTPEPGMPVLAVNTIGRHVSRYVRTLVWENGSPWTAGVSTGEVHSVPVSHGEGRFVADAAIVKDLFEKGQVAFRYCDAEGRPASAYPDNPNGSVAAIEGITSPDGRILGKMGHSERTGERVAVNIPGEKDQRLFESAVRYFAG